MIIERSNTSERNPSEDLICASVKDYLESDSDSLDDDVLRSMEAFSSDEDEELPFHFNEEESPVIITTISSFHQILNGFSRNNTLQASSGDVFRSVKE